MYAHFRGGHTRQAARTTADRLPAKDNPGYTTWTHGQQVFPPSAAPLRYLETTIGILAGLERDGFRWNRGASAQCCPSVARRS
jgi:hypothetical protein